MRTVIFDLDGTLADTSADLIAAANHCFIEMGVGPQLDAVGDAETAFHGARAMLRLGLSRMGDVDEAVIDRWYPVLLDAYDDNISVHTSLYPGAIEAVESLKSDGFAVGICTNKPSGLAEKLLNDLKIRDIFGSMIGADTLPVRKPDPRPFFAAVDGVGGNRTQSLLVGDTNTDRETSRNAGVPSVLVAFGPAGDTVATLKPEAIIEHFDELLGVSRRLLAD